MPLLDKLKPKTNLLDLDTNDFLLGTNTQQKSTDDLVIPDSVDFVIEKRKAKKKKADKKELQIPVEEEKPKKTRKKKSEETNIETIGDLKASLDGLKFKAKKITKKAVDKIQEIVDVVKNDDVSDVEELQELTTEVETVSQEIKDTLHINDSEHDTEEIVDEIVETLNDAVENIPDVDSNLELGELIITDSKSKAGYTKTIVGFKKDTPKILSQLATVAKKASEGVIQPRTMDLRTIGNTNKTQLRNNEIKLLKRSFTFKPNHTKMKVSKYNRFIISIADDFESTHKAYIYLQESRDKFATEIVLKDNTDIEFYGKLIYTFYTEGFDTTVRKIQFRGTENPLLRLIPNIVKTHQFKAKPVKVNMEQQQVKAILIKGTTGLNPWLSMLIQESKDYQGLYDIVLTADFDESWKLRVNATFHKSHNPLDITKINSSEFRDKMIKLFNETPEAFKKAGLDIEDNDTKNTMLINKLKYRPMRQVFLEFLDYIEDGNDDLEIVNTYSRLETSKLLDLGKADDYEAELIIVKNQTYKYVIISYFAMQIVAGDKRAGRDYITRQEYYQKYSVKDRRPYQERNNTIIARGNPQRNYNARPRMFKVEYMKNGSDKQLEMTAKTFKEINDVLNLI